MIPAKYGTIGRLQSCEPGLVRSWFLGPVSGDQQSATIDALAAWQPDFVAANHCTGFPMMSALRERFGVKFIAAFVGTVIEW